MECYRTQGTCCRMINFEVKNNTITQVEFVGGCQGNTKGIEKLVVGMNVDEVIKKLKNISCRNNTSCPDQLATALEKYKQKGE